MANKLVSYLRGKSKAMVQTSDPEDLLFLRSGGLKYEEFFKQIHATYLFDWYMEIGCRSGALFSHARGKTIAVDPYFQVTRNVVCSKPVLHIFQQKSDDFFASGFMEKTGIKLSLSFLDGMHLFEYLLRDFINAERNSLPDGVITLHDCCPTDFAMTTRDLAGISGRRWTGDVWKMIPILQKCRPDLRINVLNCGGTGLVLISNLSPSSVVLQDNYDEIINTYTDIDLRTFGIEAFFASFSFTDAQGYLDAGAPDFARIALGPEHVFQPIYITP